MSSSDGEFSDGAEAEAVGNPLVAAIKRGATVPEVRAILDDEPSAAISQDEFMRVALHVAMERGASAEVVQVRRQPEGGVPSCTLRARGDDAGTTTHALGPDCRRPVAHTPMSNIPLPWQTSTCAAR